jgi:hypothetical protein
MPIVENEEELMQMSLRYFQDNPIPISGLSYSYFRLIRFQFLADPILHSD